VNTHPTFIYGLALLVVYWASGQVSFAVGGLRAEAWNPEKRRHLLLVTILSLATLPLNPYGVRLPGYLLHMALDEPLNLAYIQEWRAPDFNEFYGKVFLVLLLVFLLAVLALRPRYRWEEFALLLCAAWLACLHMRFLILFAIVFAPFLAGLLVRWVQLHHAGHERYLLNGALMGMIAAGVVVFLPSRSTLDGVVRRGFPVGAVEYLRANPVNAPMFNDDSWGAFLTRSLGRQHQVFIDGRIDAYEPAGVLADYLQIVHLNNDPERLLRKYGVESCLLDPAEPFATFLANSPEWRKVYADKVSVLFVRWPHPVDIMNVSTHASTEDLGQRGSSREAGH
jgi:hypothetical protein